MKKFLSVLVIVAFTLIIAACQKTTSKEATTSGTTGATSGTTTTATTKENREPVTIKYAAHNTGNPGDVNLERLMIEEFQTKYPWITVEIVEMLKKPDPNNEGQEVNMGWDEFLTAKAAVKDLPDVFAHFVIPNAVTSEWTYDLTNIMTKDPEFLNIAEDIRNAAVYEGQYHAVPWGISYMGYFVNKTLFEEAFLDTPTYGMKFTDLLELAKAVTVQNNDGNGIVGIEGVDRVFEWYPAAVNANLGWFTFDGQKYNLNSQAFAEAVALQKTLLTEKDFVFDALTGEERTSHFGNVWPWGVGRHAVKWDQSTSVGWIYKNSKDENNAMYGNDYDFIGTPGVIEQDGKVVTKIPAVLDYLVVAGSTKHPEEAYLLAKWMGFGKDGYLKRLELSQTVQGVSLINTTPLQQDEELLDAFFALYEGMTEFRKVVESDGFIIEGLKMVPGFNESRYTGQYDQDNNMWAITHKVLGGEVNLADIATQLNNAANREYNAKIALIKEKINK